MFGSRRGCGLYCIGGSETGRQPLGMADARVNGRRKGDTCALTEDPVAVGGPKPSKPPGALGINDCAIVKALLTVCTALQARNPTASIPHGDILVHPHEVAQPRSRRC